MKKLIFILVLMVPLAAFARFEKLVSDIDVMFAKMTGYVVNSEEGTIYTDLGRDKGVYNGMTLKVYRENEPIIHPITGEVLGNKKLYVGDLKITDVQDKFSTGVMTVQQRAPQKGDLAIVTPPVDVTVNIEDMPKRLDVLLREDLSKANNIVVKDKARLGITFTQREEGGIEYKITDSVNKAVIYSKYFSDVDTQEGQSMNAAKDIVTGAPIDKAYKSMAVGHIKNDDKIYIVTATEKAVDFYTFDGKGFKPAGSIDAKLKDIQHVEVADLNGNGVEEIFVVTVVDDQYVKTKAFEFDGKKFKEVEDNIPYILRTVYVKGIKKIVAQRIGQDGTYLGNVQELVWRDGKYERGQVVSPARGVNVYGFGYADIDGDGTDEVFNINEDYKIDVYNGTVKKYTSVEEFGQTPYSFTMELEKLEQFKTTEEDDPFTTEKNKKYIKGRVFVNSDGNIYVVKNSEKYKMLNRMKAYGSSYFTVFGWDGKRLRQVWTSDVFQPVIVDYFMYEEFGRTYLFMLRNFSDGLFSGDKSELIYIETK
ncbi:VCBS repeat-containing protein [Seleniivibrio sp.]|uniref:FG-GAP repeat domain-containing protein n=1 Tax=Seleniivibrio sp. TaxID=2898801 RepID=UPI0025F08A5D|nr:VCBS repeat-containing protein [Seleniivibrio sp.]MCD8553645.1 hypothetical protein [Seleniivibrio sp.]